jgi:hypothetical protein
VAMPLMRDFLDAGRDDPSVHFLLGCELLAENDEGGLRHLQRAMELDPDVTPDACAAAAEFLHARGRTGDAEAFVHRARTHAETEGRARAERDVRNLRHNDRFLPHGLSDAQAQALSTHLASVRGLKRALLVRKEVAILPQTPCYVLGVEPVWTPEEVEGGNNPSDQLAERVCNSVSLPGTLLVATLQEGWGLQQALARVPGAELYRRGGRVGAGAR